MSGFEILLLFGFFLAVAGGTVWAGYVLVVSPAERAGNDPLEALNAGQVPERAAALARAFRVLGEAVPAQEKRTDPVRKRLVAAGYRWPAALSIFNGIAYATGFLFALLGAWWSFLYQGDGFMMLIAAVGGGGFGYLIPNRLLDWLISNRAARLRQALPFALDLLVLGIEAGQTLDYALAETSRELRFAFPDLAREFASLSVELKSATDRTQVFQELGTRNAEPELKKLASLFLDSDRFGTSLAPTLRAHARYLRTRRRQLAQEHARKIGVKLIFPVFFLIFPCVLLVTVGPAVLHILSALQDMSK